MYHFSANDIEIAGYPEPKTGGMLTGSIPSGIKVLHKATGIVVICNKHRHQHKNREEALREMDAKLVELKKDA